MSANAKSYKRKSHSPRIRRKKTGAVSWLVLIGGALLIIGGIGIVVNETNLFQSDWQGAVTDARTLDAGELLPLAEPVNPIDGFHDMQNMPDPNTPGKQVPADQPQANVSIPVTAYDFGTIPPGPGNVSQVFHIQNTGNQTLEISSVVTSCGCTQGLLSSSVIPPGTRAELTAIFDPDFHADTTGPVKRVIWLETNDPDQPVAEVSFTANVQ